VVGTAVTCEDLSDFSQIENKHTHTHTEREREREREEECAVELYCFL
jgi:hypothetical protein